MLAAHRTPSQDRDTTKQDSALTIPVPKPGSAEIVGPIPALKFLEQLERQGVKAKVVMLDPWYRVKNAKGRATYLREMVPLLEAASRVGDHVFVWGFPEAVARLVDHWPESLRFAGWVTWFFKNAPSRAKGWRPSQQTCLHLRRKNARLYPEHFYSERQKAFAEQGKLEFKMTPFSVIEAGLLSGFIKKSEQTGYPAQKPKTALEPLLKMTMKPGDLVIDPTCGSGTTGEVAIEMGCAALLGDESSRALKITRKRIEKTMRASGRADDVGRMKPAAG
ncbi:MAG: DNA methyltransferase [Stenotrophobium sp.]